MSQSCLIAVQIKGFLYHTVAVVMARRNDMFETVWKVLLERVFPFVAAKVDQTVRLTVKELPKLESLLFRLFDMLFSPRQLLRQIVIVTAVQVLILFGRFLGELGTIVVVFLSKAETEQKNVLNELRKAVSYHEWKNIAKRLDYLR